VRFFFKLRSLDLAEDVTMGDRSSLETLALSGLFFLPIFERSDMYATGLKVLSFPARALGLPPFTQLSILAP